MRYMMVLTLFIVFASCSNSIQSSAPLEKKIEHIDGAPLNAESFWTYTAFGIEYSYAIWFPGSVTITHDSLIFQGKRTRRSEGPRYFAYEEDGSTSHWVPMGLADNEVIGYHWINLPISDKPVATYSLDTTYSVYLDSIECHATQRVEYIGEEVIMFEEKSHPTIKTLVETECISIVSRDGGSMQNQYEYSRFVIFWSPQLQLPVRVDARIKDRSQDESFTYYVKTYSLR